MALSENRFEDTDLMRRMDPWHPEPLILWRHHIIGNVQISEIPHFGVLLKFHFWTFLTLLKFPELTTNHVFLIFYKCIFEFFRTDVIRVAFLRETEI